MPIKPTQTLDPAERARLRELAALADSERPLLADRFRRADQAAAEQTLSGSLRRAVHAGPFDLVQLEQRTKISAARLADFLEGTTALTWDEAEHLVEALGLELVRTFRAPPAPPRSN
jgi:hypothetical protein